MMKDLFLAAARGQVEIVENILNNGINPDDPEEYSVRIFIFKNTSCVLPDSWPYPDIS
jgi:hypothetical protein